ncbi:hypothetical protein PYW08_009150 [Mythimna loreyi]|uniref:Uncharacterized protein n=1 Tax=Mythimna loreyi TaxID=667449 RepID=A0ACC2Q9M5_9NEOP|nr:hypothetical protein PYW08_009150 [Mythimna loreyi]
MSVFVENGVDAEVFCFAQANGGAEQDKEVDQNEEIEQNKEFEQNEEIEQNKEVEQNEVEQNEEVEQTDDTEHGDLSSGQKNLSLFQPKKDQCDTCCAFKAGNLSEDDYHNHITRKDAAREEKKKDKDLALAGEKHLHGRINKILALVPRHRAPSEASNKSDSDEELHVPPSPDSYFSSPALSIASSLELLNLLDSDENERERDDEPLPVGFSPILQEVFPSPSQEPVYSNLPSMSSLPLLPTPPSVAVTVRRKTRSKVPVVVAKKAKKPKKKFSLTYKWKKVPFQHRVETLEDDFEDLDIQEITP